MIKIDFGSMAKGGIRYMQLLESGEMYLETILILSFGGEPVRSIDIVDHMGFSKPSVSRAVGLLKEGGFINVDRSGFITFTDAGREVAEKIYDRHNIITECLVRLGVDRETASEDACKIEHDISEKSFSAIKEYMMK